MELTEAEREALASAVHDALRCNCDSGEGDRMVACELAGTVEAIITARLEKIEALVEMWGRERAERGPLDTILTGGAAEMVHAALTPDPSADEFNRERQP